MTRTNPTESVNVSFAGYVKNRKAKTGSHLEAGGIPDYAYGNDFVLRQKLKAIPGFYPVAKAIVNTGYGLGAVEDTSVLDPNNSVIGHYYHRQINTLEEIEKIKMPEIYLDREKNDERREAVTAMFDGILPVRMEGVQPWFNLWDPISVFMGVEPTLYDIMDRPEFIHAVCRRMTDMRMYELDEYERLGLLDPWLQTAHCTYTYTSKQPGPDYDPAKPLARDCWSVGLAQMFSSVGPQTYDEFEVAYAKEYLARTGFCNYGCCDPLDRKIGVVRKLPNIRKISISPWADPKIAAPQMAGDYILARKPNPAYVGGVYFDLDGARKEIKDTLDACRACGTPSEYILKDISTVQYQPERLEQWEKMAMECVQR